MLGENRRFVLVMAAGSIVGSFIGGRLLGFVPNAVAPSAACRHPGVVGGQGLEAQVRV